MTDAGPAVALLFDDTELGTPLRDALRAHGARIVHEGGLDSLDRQRLHETGADVIVVNLDDTAEDALERLYALIDGDRPRVVFNDAQASRKLTGWDRDRWARHLAVKVLRAGELDPPRPADAGRMLPDAAAFGPPVRVDGVDLAPAPGPVGAWVPGAADAAGAAPEDEQRVPSESEALAAELELLLASAEFDAGQADADADTDTDTDTDALAAAPAGDPSSAARERASQESPALQLEADFGSVGGVPAAEPPAPAAVSVPADWALLDEDASAAVIAASAGADPDAFGVRKLSAADYLAPSAEHVAHGFEPVLNLQLEAMTEAIAPQPISVAHEMHLDELHMALARLVVTGAAVDGAAAASTFFAALPAVTPWTFLHTQHLDGQSAADLVEQLAGVCALPVRLASAGSFARVGEVLVVPPAQRVRVHRDGRVELQSRVDEGAGATRAEQPVPMEGLAWQVDVGAGPATVAGPASRSGAAQSVEPAIDDSFVAAAESFGREALAIVFFGHGGDALAGAQAIHERGGKVWVEAVSAADADMVSAIRAAHLVDFSGTPQALAAHLVEVFA